MRARRHTLSSMKVRKKTEVRGAEVPKVETMEVGLLSSSLAWFRNEPATKEPRKTVMNCTSTTPEALIEAVPNDTAHVSCQE